MCSQLTPRARIPDTRIPQLMQPCCCFLCIWANPKIQRSLTAFGSNIEIVCWMREYQSFFNSSFIWYHVIFVSDMKSFVTLGEASLVFVPVTNFQFPFTLCLFQMKGFLVLFWVLIDCRFAEMPPIVWKVFNVIFNFLISYRILANIAASGRLQELHQMNLTFARKTFWVVKSVISSKQ